MSEGLVTLDLMKEHLKIETEEDEEFVETLISEVSQAARDFCWTEFDEDSVPEPVSLGIRLKVAFFYENRDISDRPAYLATDLAWKALLYPYKDLDNMF